MLPWLSLLLLINPASHPSLTWPTMLPLWTERLYDDSVWHTDHFSVCAMLDGRMRLVDSTHLDLGHIRLVKASIEHGAHG